MWPWLLFGILPATSWGCLACFSAFARLEPPGEPFEYDFHDFVKVLVVFLCIFQISLVKTHRIVGDRLAPSVHPFSFPSSPFYPSAPSFNFFYCLLACLLAGASERSEAERDRCVVQAAPQAPPEDHSGCNICFSSVADLLVLGKIARTVVLAVFWLPMFLSIWG